ncbi:MAG: acylphosphatase [Verrucomicrobiota bacterium]
MIARQTIFEGRVQGVGFRYSCKDLAKGFDVSGSVENCPDGSVRLILQGEEDEVNEFLAEIIEESSLATLIKSHLTIPLDPNPNLRGFSILR